MNKKLYEYTEEQFLALENFIGDNLGSRYDYIVHEIESEYIHTDIFVVKSRVGDKSFITCGMGSAEMSAPNSFKRCELKMSLSGKFALGSNQSFILANELVRLSKFPFREDTWFGNGHTMQASKQFKENFGYDFFAFKKLPLSVKLPGIDEEINFLAVVPIYAQERNWCVENHTLALIDKLYEKYNEDIFKADFRRDVFLPEVGEDELLDYNLMTVLEIDRPTLNKLQKFLEEQEQNGIEVTYDLIGKWIEENR